MIFQGFENIKKIKHQINNNKKYMEKEKKLQNLKITDFKYKNNNIKKYIEK